MRCPECSELLNDMTVSAELKVPECPSCGGVWISLADWSLMRLCLGTGLEDVDRWESTFDRAWNTGQGVRSDERALVH